MPQTLDAIAHYLKGRVIGDGTTLIRGVNNIDRAQDGDITFAEDPRRLAQAVATNASAVIIPADLSELAGKAGISVTNPKLAFARVLEMFHPDPIAAPGIHPTAVIGQRARLGERLTVRPYAVIGDDVSLGAGAGIESGVHIGDRVSIGPDCLIGPNVVIYRQTVIGARVRIHGGTVIGGDGFGYVFHDGRHVKVPQVGNVVIEDDVELGCNVCVDRATIGSTLIKRGTKVDNQVQIAHNDQIGEHVIITGHVGFSGSVTVGNYAVFGGKAGIVDHVTIGDRVQVGAASVVTKDIPAGETVWGYPARPIREAKRQLAALAQLPKLLQRLVALEARRNSKR